LKERARYVGHAQRENLLVGADLVLVFAGVGVRDADAARDRDYRDDQCVRDQRWVIAI